MKLNGNQKRISDYYIGLDVGTSSVGWAVTDTDYNVLKFKGNAMWGARLFEEAESSATRRQIRTARRLTRRRKQRLQWLEMLFDKEISRADPSFFMRLKESSLCENDRSEDFKFPVFNDEGYTDRDYFRDYPTVYHLRRELLHSDKPHDIRLVYLALHHIVKSRGHFLFDTDISGEYKTTEQLTDEFNALISDEYETEIVFKNRQEFFKILKSADMRITDKKARLKETVETADDTDGILLSAVLDMLAGATVKLSVLFRDDALKLSEKNSLTLNSDISADYDIMTEDLGENRLNVILSLKRIFDSAKLAHMLGNHKYISEAMVEQYEVNKNDLKRLKLFVKTNAPEKYKEIFTVKRNKTDNYAAYSGKTLRSGEYSCNNEQFCKYLLKKLPDPGNTAGYEEIFAKIKNNCFLPKLRGPENSVIPNQLHRNELVRILDNAETYLDFLKEKDENGKTVKEKIISVFDFKIPYYVGPLNRKSPRAWLERKNEKIYPWNFENTVNLENSLQNFIGGLISKCQYTGEDVLPRDSLLFSEYCVLNEINPIAVNGEKIPVDIKNEIYTELFLNSKSKVTKKSIKNFLLKKGCIKADDEISGIDDNIKSKLKSYHDFSSIMSVEENYDSIEDIIRSITIFGDDKKSLKKWLKNNHPELNDEQAAKICRLKYTGWGKLSETLLTEIYTPDENGEAHSVIDMLKSTNNNFAQLMSGNYKFAENAKAHLKEKIGERDTIGKMISDMYISSPVKRSLLQTARIVDEIIDIRRSAPKKIFIEVARDRNDENAKRRTVTRKTRLLELYKSCKKEYPHLYEMLDKTDESKLRSDALYLYYTQFGKCMYTGEPISLERLSADYDIDHIFPQSKIKDDSIDNRVLVSKTYNKEKSNIYPLKAEWQDRMRPFWNMLKEKGLISGKKYERLIRTAPLSEDELSSFVERQLVETRQSTKALAAVLSEMYKDAGTRIVYSKAVNVSDFRQEFGLLKCREINDLHHAKDAYLNIVVGNVYDTKFTESFFKNIKNESYSLNKVFDYSVKGAWTENRSIASVKSTMAKNNIIITRMPYEKTGAISDLQIRPAANGQLSIKQGKSINTYGGYNKIQGAYFCVVRHTLKGKTAITIEPVYIYKKELYEKDPIAYCKEILQLRDPVIIYPRLLIDSLIELDGKLLSICGRSDKQLLFRHEYQLCVSQEDEKYIKEISKYVSRSKIEKAENGITLAPNSQISSARNIALYNLFLQKLKLPIYNRLFSGVAERLGNRSECFSELRLITQCRLLLEILKLFKCDRQLSVLEDLSDNKQDGLLRYNKSLNKVSSAFAINCSVTGLYKYRTDLLK